MPKTGLGISSVHLIEQRNAYWAQLVTLFPTSWSLAVACLADSLAIRSWVATEGIDNGVDIVACADFLGFGALMAGLELPPVVVTGHGTLGQISQHSHNEMVGGKEDQLVVCLEEISMSAAAAINCYSPTNLGYWEKHCGRSVTFTKAPFIRDDGSHTRASKRQQSHRTLTALVVGRLQNWKGPVVLMDALRLMRCPGLLQVKWFGSDTNTGPGNEPMSGFLRREYRDLWGSHFQWRCPITPESLGQERSTADFIIVPSIWDTFNYTALEALSGGLPIVISDAAGASYLVESEINGYIFPAGDSVALASTLDQILSNPAKLLEMGQAAKSKIDCVFSPEAIAGDHLGLFKEVRRERRGLAARASVSDGLELLLDGLLNGGGIPKVLDSLPIRALLRATFARVGTEIWPRSK